MILEFKQTVKSTKFIFVLKAEMLEVAKYYNGHGLRYSYFWDLNEINVGELARLVEMFKRMPDEMWEQNVVESVESH